MLLNFVSQLVRSLDAFLLALQFIEPWSILKQKFTVSKPNQRFSCARFVWDNLAYLPCHQCFYWWASFPLICARNSSGLSPSWLAVVRHYCSGDRHDCASMSASLDLESLSRQPDQECAVECSLFPSASPMFSHRDLPAEKETDSLQHHVSESASPRSPQAPMKNEERDDLQ